MISSTKNYILIYLMKDALTRDTEPANETKESDLVLISRSELQFLYAKIREYEKIIKTYSEKLKKD